MSLLTTQEDGSVVCSSDGVASNTTFLMDDINGYFAMSPGAEGYAQLSLSDSIYSVSAMIYARVFTFDTVFNAHLLVHDYIRQSNRVFSCNSSITIWLECSLRTTFWVLLFLDLCESIVWKTSFLVSHKSFDFNKSVLLLPCSISALGLRCQDLPSRCLKESSGTESSLFN